MPITYAVDRELGVIFETWTGPVPAVELSRHWKVFLDDPEVMSCRRTLADLRNCTVEFSGNDLSHLIEKIVLPKLGTLKWRTALVVKHAVQLGVARQYEVFADYYSRDSVFENRVEAIVWLVKESAEDA